MKVVYVAGRFRGPTAWDIAENVRAAERAGFEVAQLGAMPLIPHANTAHFHGTFTDAFWLEGTLELLRRADAVLNFDFEAARSSAGTQGEIAEAQRRGLPVFTAIEGLRAWLEREKENTERACAVTGCSFIPPLLGNPQLCRRHAEAIKIRVLLWEGEWLGECDLLNIRVRAATREEAERLLSEATMKRARIAIADAETSKWIRKLRDDAARAQAVTNPDPDVTTT